MSALEKQTIEDGCGVRYAFEDGRSGAHLSYRCVGVAGELAHKFWLRHAHSAEHSSVNDLYLLITIGVTVLTLVLAVEPLDGIGQEFVCHGTVRTEVDRDVEYALLGHSHD